jgi:hypothetical protein
VAAFFIPRQQQHRCTYCQHLNQHSGGEMHCGCSSDPLLYNHLLPHCTAATHHICCHTVPHCTATLYLAAYRLQTSNEPKTLYLIPVISGHLLPSATHCYPSATQLLPSCSPGRHAPDPLPPPCTRCHTCAPSLRKERQARARSQISWWDRTPSFSGILSSTTGYRTFNFDGRRHMVWQPFSFS